MENCLNISKKKFSEDVFNTVSTEDRESECENESIQHMQKNISFAHPDRKPLPLLRCTCTKCKHEKRTGKKPLKGEDQ